jgi:hypothetical protein
LEGVSGDGEENINERTGDHMVEMGDFGKKKKNRRWERKRDFL